MTCEVKDYDDLLQCFRCQAYGHLAKVCKEKGVCGLCAEHEREQKYEGERRCINCKRFGVKEDRHGAMDEECAIRRRKVEIYRGLVDYGL